ncbi:hypothetical protein DYB28_013180 [Aphanomyces astaci]|uniref:Chromo domain-containing protein n=1 Tax=Aphanomyces astaci TaxID=112090 RepID=A0A9X8DT35_APHAT|nr:hypothetical protein DYB28_013180 [Aphanomyces astaci]
METQQLVPPYEVTVHHACRLKMYHEGGREVTDDLEAQIAFGDGGFHVERLDEARCVDGQHQVLVKLLGLDDEESSWEPAANLLDDIPVVFRKWAAANKEGPASVDGSWLESQEEAGDKTDGCVLQGAYKDSAFVHVSDPKDAPWAQWKVFNTLDGKLVLQADTGKFLSRCNNCAPGAAYPDEAFVHVDDWHASPWAQWVCVDAGNGKIALQADSGRYLARCEGCIPGAYPNTAFVHATSVSEPYAQWAVVSQNPSAGLCS